MQANMAKICKIWSQVPFQHETQGAGKRWGTWTLSGRSPDAPKLSFHIVFETLEHHLPLFQKLHCTRCLRHEGAQESLRKPRPYVKSRSWEPRQRLAISVQGVYLDLNVSQAPNSLFINLNSLKTPLKKPKRDVFQAKEAGCRRRRLSSGL